MMPFRRDGCALLIAAAVAGCLCAQPAPTPTYTYDVVSIHKADPAERSSGFGPGPQSGLHVRNETAIELLKFAFAAHEHQFESVPAWAKADRYEIELTPDRIEAPLSDRASPAEVDGWLMRNRQRTQAVLRDRFGLLIRSETREMPLYALTVAKGGHKLSAPGDPDRVSLNINGGHQIVARSSTMKDVGG